MLYARDLLRSEGFKIRHSNSAGQETWWGERRFAVYLQADGSWKMNRLDGHQLAAGRGPKALSKAIEEARVTDFVIRHRE